MYAPQVIDDLNEPHNWNLPLDLNDDDYNSYFAHIFDLQDVIKQSQHFHLGVKSELMAICERFLENPMPLFTECIRRKHKVAL